MDIDSFFQETFAEKANARLVLGSNLVTLSSFQWGLSVNKEWLQRDLGATPFGKFYRDRLNIARRMYELTFIKTEAVMDALRLIDLKIKRDPTLTLSFYPDITDLSTTIQLDWQDTTEFERIIENRESVILTLLEKL